MVFGADTGVGKTELVCAAAKAAAEEGKEPYVFLLEAEPGELSARLYFQELAKRTGNRRMDYSAWWRGKYRDADQEWREEIQKHLQPTLDRMHVLYHKKGDFTALNLRQQLEGIAYKAEIVLLDHIHMVAGTKADASAELQVARLLREMALSHDVSVIAASHVRKKEAGQRRPLPGNDDLHGDSNMYKLFTQIVMFARDFDCPRPRPHLSPTLVHVTKDRKGRSSPYVARVMFDVSQSKYEGAYELGRIDWKDRKLQFLTLDRGEIPYWAEHEAGNLQAAKGLPF